MTTLRGSKTERNLLTAFAGESQARNRYTFYASVAKKEGYIQISKIFEETAEQEKEHAKRFYKFLEGTELTLNANAAFPAGIISDTKTNLIHAAAGEAYEWIHMYPDFAKIAMEEGFETIAKVFEAVSVAEKQHEKRYRDLANNIESGRVFKREKQEKWRCLNCGYVHEGNDAPSNCPACAHPKAYFELLAENW